MVFDSASDRIRLHDTPASSHQLLDNDHDGYGKLQTQDWNYCLLSVVLSYLQAMTQSDITLAVQQCCAWFCNNPQQSHEKAVKMYLSLPSQD